MTLRLLDDGIAATAATHVATCNDPRLAKRFARLQVMLHSSGLAATYMHCIAHKEGQSDAYATAAKVIEKELGVSSQPPSKVYDRLVITSSPDVLRITGQVLRVFRWVARLAVALGPASLATTDPQGEATP